MEWNPLELAQEQFLRTQYPIPHLYDFFLCDYALCGALPMRQYVPERATYSLDVYIAFEDADRNHKQLIPFARETDYFSDTHRYYILKRNSIFLSVIACKDHWINQALKDAQTHLDPISQEPKLTFEWLVLSKMSHGRRQDFMDCARLISRASQVEIDATKDLLEEWMPKALPELRKLYEVGKLERLLSKAYKNETSRLNDWQCIAHHFMNNVDKRDIDTFSIPSSWDEILKNYSYTL